MIVEYDNSFLRDLKKLKDRDVGARVARLATSEPPEGSVIARFTMDPHTGRVARVG